MVLVVIWLSSEAQCKSLVSSSKAAFFEEDRQFGDPPESFGLRDSLRAAWHRRACPAVWTRGRDWTGGVLTAEPAGKHVCRIPLILNFTRSEAMCPCDRSRARIKRRDHRVAASSGLRCGAVQ